MSKSREEMTAIIKKQVRRSGRTMIIVGLLCLGLGAFMIALHQLGLDSELQNAKMGAKVALYVVAILFIIGGVWMFYVALFKNAENGNHFLDMLHGRPDGIEEIYVQFNVGTNPPQYIDLYTHQVPKLAHLALVVKYQDGKSFQLPMKKDFAGEIIHYCRQLAPHATR